MNCTNCGKELREGAAFCTSCGTPVSASASVTTSESIARVSASGDKICTGCGHRMKAEAKFCVSCGTKVTSASSAGGTATYDIGAKPDTGVGRDYKPIDRPAEVYGAPGTKLRTTFRPKARPETDVDLNTVSEADNSEWFNNGGDL